MENKGLLNKYKFCLLDTNFVSMLSKSSFNGKEVEKKKSKELLLKHIGLPDNLICMSVQTIKEISRNDEAYSAFKFFFKTFPFCILHSFDVIINLEKVSNNITKENLVLKYFPPFSEHILLNFLDNESFIKVLIQSKEWDKSIARDEIEFHRQNKFITKDRLIKDGVNRIAQQYDTDVECITNERYPARLLLIHNQIFQFKNSNTYDEKVALSNANDRMICVATPYVNKIFTENKQAGFLNQMKKQGILNHKIEIYTMRDIR